VVRFNSTAGHSIGSKGIARHLVCTVLRKKVPVYFGSQLFFHKFSHYGPFALMYFSALMDSFIIVVVALFALHCYAAIRLAS